MNSRETLPMMLSANDIQTMGFTSAEKVHLFPDLFCSRLVKGFRP